MYADSYGAHIGTCLDCDPDNQQPGPFEKLSVEDAKIPDTAGSPILGEKSCWTSGGGLGEYIRVAVGQAASKRLLSNVLQSRQNNEHMGSMHACTHRMV